MPRKKYPSDHRRYFRVMEDILDDGALRELDPRSICAWLLLLACFNRQRAHETQDTIVLPWSRAMEIMGRGSRAQVLARARRLTSATSATFALVPEGLLCHIRNWSKFQGLTPTNLRSVSVATPPPTPTPTPIRQDPKKDLGPSALNPPWGPLRNLRPKEVAEIDWERFLRDNFETMRLWKDEHRATWPAVVRRFWARQGSRFQPEPSLDEIALEAQRLLENAEP